METTEIIGYKWCVCNVERVYPEYVYINANSFMDGIACTIKIVYCKVEKHWTKGDDGLPNYRGIRTVPVRREEMENI